NVSIELTEEARVWLRDKGYHKLYGARPMGRVIQNELKRPLADAILFGALANGGTAKVALGKGDDGAEKLVIETVSAPPKPVEAPVDDEEEE
ncbi:MAG: ATP-dependent Clp protease ATP-binding subunit ClpA, partial [Dehalococcoidia bacterium]